MGLVDLGWAWFVFTGLVHASASARASLMHGFSFISGALGLVLLTVMAEAQDEARWHDCALSAVVPLVKDKRLHPRVGISLCPQNRKRLQSYMSKGMDEWRAKNWTINAICHKMRSTIGLAKKFIWIFP